jgi:hypothetical protein
MGWVNPDVPHVNDGKAAAMPEDGNIFTSGRVLSPSIDEIWIYLKKLTSGRIADTDIEPGGGPSSANGDFYNSLDTRLQPEVQLSLPSNKKGDALSRDGLKYVNAAAGIRYKVDENILATAESMLANALANSDVAPYLSRFPITAQNGMAQKLLKDTLTNSGTWAPRDRPYSLREMEGVVRNIQYNVNLAFNFLANHKASTGNVDTTKKHGTLYQLHRDYKNVWTGNNSKWTKSSDTEWPTETVSEYGKNVDALVGSDAADIYLAADGSWRYLFDHVRIPILDEKY